MNTVPSTCYQASFHTIGPGTPVETLSQRRGQVGNFLRLSPQNGYPNLDLAVEGGCLVELGTPVPD